ncbi:spore coat protein U domain-containing protein [Pseudidiomarina sp. 1APP75-32.1]|uniref:Spore coat protein U domain-containing protein n=1 Tax=Pseudidiomarina terrestris TaxID=2820060 RepID=A0AAW7QXP9_9GAMM|nr:MULTISPECIES: spore coat U domain-containing protein [unclassified Pseudidiomarina]MDN7124529.1 spore coat protein U domain-containing protein [Pseudidiomarina sp. 1APP75-32.1]MDN7129180.1 spore coat protein U domain-containing protein [Pseudidiomarina sp. 1APR75-15]
MRRIGVKQLVYATALALWLGNSSALASCLVSAQGVSFGSYDSLASAPTESTGVVEVSCDAQTSYSILLSAGSGAYSERKMFNAEHALSYNLYTSPTYSFIWGDGSGATALVNGMTSTTQLHDIYGRVPAGQEVAVGVYSDTIMVTIEF